MIRNNKYVKNNINAINTILISNCNIKFKIHFIPSPSYVAILPRFHLSEQFFLRGKIDILKKE